MQGVIKACRSLRRDKSIRAAILSGDGPSFCAGLDFKTVLSKPVHAAAGTAMAPRTARG